MTWLPIKVGELLTLEYGKALPRASRVETGSIPVAGSNGSDGVHNVPLVEGPGIVVGRKGSAGKVTWFNEDFWPIDTTYFVQHDARITNIRWLYYLLQALKLERLNRTTGVPGLNRNDAYAEDCFLPPRKEQSRIVELLDEADRLRRLRHEADAKANRILPALFLRMFGDPATNPMGWPHGTLGAFGVRARYGLGQPPKQSASGLPLLRATNVDAGSISEKNLIYVDPTDVPPGRNAFLAPEEVLVVRSGAYTGDVAQVTEKWSGSVAGYDLILTPASGWTGEFIEQYLLTPFVQRSYFDSQKGRAGQPHLNSTQLEATPAFNPPEDCQSLFAQSVRSVRSLRDQCRISGERLEQTFKLLLDHAFSGLLTAKWREANLKELMAEMKHQARILNLPMPKEMEALL